MKTNSFIFLSLFLNILLISSCKTDDPAGVYAGWNQQNKSYFNNMKDSTGYLLYTIPAERGGSQFYYKVTVAGNQDSISPQDNDYVKVNYRGKLINGNVFDENYTGLVPTNDSTANRGTFW